MRNRILGLTATVILLAGAFALFEFTDLDLHLQDHFYDFTKHQWFFDKQDVWPRILFYTGPKWVLGVVGGLLIVWLLVPVRWRPQSLQKVQLPWPARRLWFVLLCLAIVPATIGFMKKRSDLYCPWSIDRYGGDRPHLHFFEPLPPNYPPDCGKCFPAGHASGGFALLALYYLGRTRRGQLLGLSMGMVAGWTLGLYQMLKGAHFLSHTIVTMLIAALIAQALAWLMRIDTLPNPTGDLSTQPSRNRH